MAKCPEAWQLYLAWREAYTDDARKDLNSQYHRLLDEYRLHNASCDQCHGRTVELTEIAEMEE